MTGNVKEAYFSWIVEVVSGGSCRKLLRLLHETAFYPRMRMDRNRMMDGLALRDQFAYEQGISERRMNREMAGTPCSVLEMMAALAQRCEIHIMSDPDYGDRTSEWFFDMIHSLGLGRMYDRDFHPEEAEDILDRFQRGEYSPNGAGGLFTVHGRCDLREMEIWEQAMLYFTNIYERR